MTQLLIDRATLEQLLVALEAVLDDSKYANELTVTGGVYEGLQCKEAITAGRAALAQQELPQKERPDFTADHSNVTAMGLDIAKHRDTLRAQLADAELHTKQVERGLDKATAQLAAIRAQEPVAYRWVWKSKPWDIEGWCYTNTPPTVPELQEIEPLFTSPMPAQPQDHEIRELVDRLTAIAKEYGQTQQLRERIAQEIRPFTFTKPAQDVTELVEALEKLARLGNGEHYGNSDGNMIARDALSKYKGAK